MAISQALEGIGTTVAAKTAEAIQSNQALAASLAESATNRQAQGMQLAQEAKMAPVTRASTLATALAPFQTYEQQKAQAAMDKWTSGQAWKNPWLSAGQTFVSGQNMENIATPGQQSMGTAGGAMAGAAIGAYWGPWSALVGAGVGAIAGSIK
jgi:hypothetical protein